MTDKSHATLDGLFALSNHRLMALTGRDAVAFAQAQFMNDVSLLGNGQWQWNGWLTPKGRVIALFALLRLDDETLWLMLPDADPATVVDALKRFVFRSKVAIAVRNDLHVAGRFATPLCASGATLSGDAGGGLELDMSGSAPRTLWISPSPALPAPALEAAWTAADLRHGVPRLPASQAEHWTPQQLSLERLKAFSVKKGCYPGQEIVARTHFLGKAKRGLMLISAAKPIEAGSEVRADDAVLGPVVSASADGTHWSGLAVVPLERDAAASLMVHGHPVTEEPLAEGLAR